jgi:hypothetical protein
MVSVEPTEYLAKLKPHEAIAEFKAYVESLAAEPEKCCQEDFEIPANVETVQKPVSRSPSGQSRSRRL